MAETGPWRAGDKPVRYQVGAVHEPPREEGRVEDRLLRTFIALALPAEIRGLLTEALRALEDATEPRSVRWIKPDQLHLTLKFMGAMPASLVPAMGAILVEVGATINAPELCLAGLGSFPAVERPRVIWAGLGGGTDRVDELFRMLEDGLSGLGVDRETRPLSPHITLGRVRDRVGGIALARVSAALTSVPLESLVFRARELVLVRSTLTRGGPIYESLSRATVGG